MSILLDNSSDIYFKSVIYNTPNYITEKNFSANGYVNREVKDIKKAKIFIQPGEYEFNFKESKIKLTYRNCGQPLVVESITQYHQEILIENNSLDILKEFIKDSYKNYNQNILEKKQTSKKINYYLWDDYWDCIHKKHKRDMNTLCFSDDIHYKLMENIKTFLSEEEEQEYRKYGIPYKYNILLEGYPGTGKTSLITAIASSLNLNVATITFDAEMNDKTFYRALKLIPDNTVLLLEDIDVLFKERKENDNYKSSLTFSGLLNSLDGAGSVDKQIVFMTTNYCCNLDSALKRPGRIDKIIHFDYSDKSQIKKMYEKFLNNRENNFDSFYKEIKHCKLTSAILQKYFFENRKEKDINKNISELKKVSKQQNYDGNNLNLYS